MKNNVKIQDKKTYYYLPLDGYNQPDGNVNEILLTKEEYQEAKKNYVYIYERYFDACNRAQN